jgi:2-methylcitrate dehydratase PrpD
MDVMHAALMNGISSHVFDFDDTHLRTVIHPAGPVASAILAFAEYRPVREPISSTRCAGRGSGMPHRQGGLSGSL